MLFFHKHFPAAQDSNLCKINNGLILVGSIPSCQYTFHVCQKTLNSTQLCTLLTEDYLYWMSRAWRLRRQADLPARLTEGISLVNTAAAFAFSNTRGSDLAWWMPGRDEEFVLGGGERRKLQPANPTAMILLLPPASRCESEGVAFEVLVCLAGKAPKIAQKESCGRQNLFISIFRVCVWKTGREHARKTNMTSE